MALNAQTYQHISQLGLTRFVNADAGPEGPHGVTSCWLVPTGDWHNGQRMPHTVVEDLKGQKYDTTTIEGIEYYLVPEESTNLPGRLAHYAQLTGVAELQNPPGGGVNRVAENVVKHVTVAPDAVEKYVDEHDNWEDARKKVSEEDARVSRQVSVSPAREPAEGKLVEAESADEDSKDKDTVGGTKTSSETKVKSTGDTKHH